MSTATLSTALADWIADADLADFPAEVCDVGRKAVVNSIGTAVGAYGLPSAERALDYVTGESVGTGATVLADGRRVPMSMAAFVNGVMTNALGQEETHNATGTHPSETTVPALLAAAELSEAPGRTFLEALIVGMEVTAAVASMELTPSVKYDVCQAPAVYGTIGGAAAVAKLWRLDRQQIANAIGLAANFAGGLAECIRSGTGEYHYLKGMAALHAIAAAKLAAGGAPTAPTTFEGAAGFYRLFAQVEPSSLESHDVVRDVCDDLGRRWLIPDITFKPYPVHFFNEPFIDGALELRAHHDLSGSRIRSIRLVVGTEASGSGALLKPPFERRENILGVTSFCVASALIKGHFTYEDSLDVANPDVLALIDKTTVEVATTAKRTYIEVETDGGTVVFDGDERRIDYRLSLDGVAEIARSAVMRVSDSAHAEQLVAELREVDGRESVATLLPLTVLPHRSFAGEEVAHARCVVD